MTPNTFKHSRAAYNDRSGWIATLALVGAFTVMLVVAAIVEDLVLVAR